MSFSASEPDSVATTTSAVPCGLQAAASIVGDEPRWRFRPNGPTVPSLQPRVLATRWRSQSDGIQEASAETPGDSHVVAIVLRSQNLRYTVSGRVVHDGTSIPGNFHVTHPAVMAHAMFRGPFDVLHLHVSNALIDECARDIPHEGAFVLRSEPTLTYDPMMERLGRALLEAEAVGPSFGGLYADSIGIAIITRLMAAGNPQATASARTKAGGLPKWRLKRAIEHMETRLAEPVSLADIASAVGLSRMHFAAQFKVATGLRPHEYVLRRRIERAQEKLFASDVPLVDVALSLGFQSQSHFTTVFKRFVGQPPHAWRQAAAAKGQAS